MSDPVLIREGHGYEISDRGRCTAFDDIHILANPLGGFDHASRESRVFGKQPNGNGGVTYGSHMLALGCHESDRDREPGRRDLLLMLHHGSGRRVWRLGRFCDGGDLERHILAMPERVQYALLHQMARLAEDASHEAADKIEYRWAKAHADKRLKMKRRNGRRLVQLTEPTATGYRQWDVAVPA
jgi:hypothetical protein